MKDAMRTEGVVNAISRLGLRVVLDEFGSGQSNLLSLRRLAITSLQLDRSLVKYCGTDPDLQAVIKAIAASARALDLGVGAKGVETTAQLDQLRKLCLAPASHGSFPK
jgi:EAL domain-containing protein (putative c-di-GMP-specific phosphodiesterase class I)